MIGKYFKIIVMSLIIGLVLSVIITHAYGSTNYSINVQSYLPSRFNTILEDFNDLDTLNNWLYSDLVGGDGGSGTCSLEVISSGAYEGVGCGKLTYNTPTSDSFSWFVSSLGLENLELSNFNALSFWVKGAVGGEYFKIALTTKGGNTSGRSNGSIYINDFLDGPVTTSWQKAVIPLKNFANITNFTKMNELTLSFDHNICISNGSALSGTIYLDDIRFTNNITGFSSIRVDYYSDKVKFCALGGKVNGNGTGSLTYSFDSSEYHSGSNSLKMDYDVNSGYVFFYHLLGGGKSGAPGMQIDFSDYNYLTFWAKSTNSNILGSNSWPYRGLKVEMDVDDDSGTTYFQYAGTITSTWTKFSLPLSEFKSWGNPPAIDKSKITKVVFGFDTNFLENEDKKGIVYIDEVQFEK